MAWNKSNDGARNIATPSKRDRTSNAIVSSILKGLAAALIVCVAAVVAFVFLNADSSKANVKKTNQAPLIKSNEIVVTNKVVATEVVQEITHQDPTKRYEDGVEVITSVVKTNSSGAVIEKLVLANGKKMSKIHPPKPVFENAAEQIIALAISTKPGQSMPPLPKLDASLEKDFLDSLLAPVRINDDDSDEIKELKARVLETKAYIADEVKNGRSLLEVLQEHQDMMERTADAHLMAVQELQKIREEYGEEEAGLFKDRINESFRARGIPELENVKSEETRRRSE